MLWTAVTLTFLFALALYLLLKSLPPNMAPATQQQKHAVTAFTELTNCDKRVAERHLKQHSWNLQQAVDA